MTNAGGRGGGGGGSMYKHKDRTPIPDLFEHADMSRTKALLTCHAAYSLACA